MRSPTNLRIIARADTEEMPVPRAQAIGAAAIVALALALAACAREDDPAPIANDPTSASEVPAPEAPEAGVIDELLAIDNEEARLTFENRVQELIAPCMVAKGFEYVPELSGLPEGDEPAPGSPEFVATYGYGVITDPSPADAGYLDALGLNFEYRDSLSMDQQIAYSEAMAGVHPGFAEDDVEAWAAWVPTPEELGCSGIARYGSGEGYAELMQWADLEDELEVLKESVLADSRVAKADADWASCMADAGRPGFSGVPAAEQSIRDQLSVINNDMSPYEGLGPNSTQEEVDAANDVVIGRVDALGPVEVELATADFACRDEVGYQDAFDAVNLELQQEFYDAHQAELEGYVEYLTRKYS